MLCSDPGQAGLLSPIDGMRESIQMCIDVG
jgi:hypothetical protein